MNEMGVDKITRVWLDESQEDCTMCGLCQNTCPSVFKVPEKMEIVPNPDLNQIEDIVESARNCPVSVIAYEINNSGLRDNND